MEIKVRGKGVTGRKSIPLLLTIEALSWYLHFISLYNAKITRGLLFNPRKIARLHELQSRPVPLVDSKRISDPPHHPAFV